MHDLRMLLRPIHPQPPPVRGGRITEVCDGKYRGVIRKASLEALRLSNSNTTDLRHHRGDKNSNADGAAAVPVVWNQ